MHWSYQSKHYYTSYRLVLLSLCVHKSLLEVNIHSFIHTYMNSHSFIHTYIFKAVIHIWSVIHSFIHIWAVIQSFIHIRTVINSYTSMHSLIHIWSFINTYMSIHSFIHIQAFIHSYIYELSQLDKYNKESLESNWKYQQASRTAGVDHHDFKSLWRHN